MLQCLSESYHPSWSQLISLESIRRGVRAPFRAAPRCSLTLQINAAANQGSSGPPVSLQNFFRETSQNAGRGNHLLPAGGGAIPECPLKEHALTEVGGSSRRGFVVYFYSVQVYTTLI